MVLQREIAEGTTAAEFAEIDRSPAGQGGDRGHGRRPRGRSELPRWSMGPRSPSSPPTPTRGARCCATRPPMCWLRPYSGLWPGAKYAIGPVIENGFYYDFELPAGARFSDDDLGRIEGEMRAIMAEDQPFIRHEHAVGEGLELFADQPFKREIIEAVGSGADEVDAGGTVVSTYWNADTFTDLCRGPHVPSTSRLGHFKLMRVAGAYWRGDEKTAATAADLRDGVGVGEGAQRLSAPAGGSRAARPPQTGCRARSLQLSRGDRLGSGHLPPQGRDDPPPHGGILDDSVMSRRATSSSTRRTSPRASSSRSPDTSTGSPTGCTRRWSSTGGRSTTSSP